MGGQLYIRPLQPQKWGGPVPPVPPGFTPLLACVISQLEIERKYHTKIKYCRLFQTHYAM